MVSPILELTDINKSFGHVQANKNINLKIHINVTLGMNSSICHEIGNNQI